MEEYKIQQKPEWISYDEIVDVLKDAHTDTADKGMHFTALTQTPEETEKRVLEHNGVFFVALSQDNELLGVGAILFHKKGHSWYNRNKPYAAITMVGVRKKVKGKGISNGIYREMEKLGFSRVNILTMNTAENNKIVLESNFRHGWKYVDVKSWSNTDFYSIAMAKWKDGCPYHKLFLQIMYKERQIMTHLIFKENGEYRMLLSAIRNIRNIGSGIRK